MSDNYKLTGGARIGFSNATYPFADLYVDKNVLKINASIIGNFIFKPENIVSIESYSLIPIIAQGIKITHNIPNYNSKIIFWTFKEPNAVLEEIRNTGFLNNINEKANKQNYQIIEEQQKQGGFPIKRNIAIIYIVLWNLLLLYDFVPFIINFSMNKIPFGIGVISALSLLFVSSLLLLFSENFRNLILKDAKNFSNIKKFVYFILPISGFMILNVIILNIALK